LAIKKSPRRTRLENQVGRAVVIDELPNIAALLAQRSKALHIAIFAVDAVADRDRNPRQLIRLVVQMEVHDKLAGARIGKYLGPLQNPARTEVLRIGQRHHLAAKLPVHQVRGCVAGDIAFLRVVGGRAVLAKPVVDALPQQNAGAMPLNLLPAIIQPDFARTHDRRRPKRLRRKKKNKQSNAPNRPFPHIDPFLLPGNYLINAIQFLQSVPQGLKPPVLLSVLRHG
jgi:hypothetical protein